MHHTCTCTCSYKTKNKQITIGTKQAIKTTRIQYSYLLTCKMVFYTSLSTLFPSVPKNSKNKTSHKGRVSRRVPYLEVVPIKGKGPANKSVQDDP